MKKSLFGFTLFVFGLFVIIVTASSCRRSAYPREVYRGPGARYNNSSPVKANRAKFKSSGSYRVVKPRPSTNRY